MRPVRAGLGYADRNSERWCLMPGPEEGYEARCDRRLRVNKTGVPFVKEGDVGPVATIFKPHKRALRPLVFRGCGELVDVLLCAGLEPLRVVEVFDPCGQGSFGCDLFAGGEGDALPGLQQVVTGTGFACAWLSRPWRSRCHSDSEISGVLLPRKNARCITGNDFMLSEHRVDWGKRTGEML